MILTPHVGGSTEEAQERIGLEVARKLIEYSDVGNTIGAVNFPAVQLPTRHGGVRFIHVHRNVPGMLRGINEVFSAAGANIVGQYLQADGEVGYVVLDAEEGPFDPEAVLETLRGLKGTIRARLLYGRR